MQQTFNQDNLCLRITTSNGLEIPCVGYFELDVSVDGVTLPEMGFLVVRDSADSQNREEKRIIPGLLGMNILGPLVEVQTQGTCLDSSNLSFLRPL